MSSPNRSAAISATLIGAAVLLTGLLPALFIDWTRRAGSLGKLSATGLLAIAALVTLIGVATGIVFYRAKAGATIRPADLWVSTFLAFATWSVGMLTLVPGLVFLRLTDERSLDDYGPRFFVEWAVVCLVVAALSYACWRWSLRTLARDTTQDPVAA
jgi:hypothetical protein